MLKVSWMKGMFHNDRQVITVWYKFNSTLFHDVCDFESLRCDLCLHILSISCLCFNIVYSSDAQWSIHIWLCFRNAGNQTPLDLAYQDENSDVIIVLYLIGQGANAALKPVFKGKSEMHHGFNFLDWAIERKHRLLVCSMLMNIAATFIRKSVD